MRTIISTRYGGPEVLELVEAPTPEPTEGQVRISIAATSVNPVDVAVREGYLDTYTHGRSQFGYGWDVAGTVDAVGPGVSEFAIGQRVVAVHDIVGAPSGAHADVIVVPVDAVALAPTSAAPTAAATLPLNGLTAVQVLDLLDLQPGQRLLVTGAAGGLGGYAVPLADQRGLHVTAVGSARDEEWVRRSGADEFIARDAALPRGAFDAVLDAAMVGGSALAAVRDGGKFIAVNDPAEPASERGIEVQTVHIKHNGKQLAELVRAVDDGVLELRVAHVLPLREIAEAHRLLEKGGLRGRIVLTP